MTLGCKDIGIRKLEFVTKTQFLSYLVLFCTVPVVQSCLEHKQNSLLN